MRFITMPGIGGSGVNHWQTLWEKDSDNLVRFQPSSWESPDLSDWLAALDECVSAEKEAPVLVAHSLSCLLAAEYLHRFDRPIAGAFLVAVPDPKSGSFPTTEASEFTAFHRGVLPCPVIVVASSSDPFGTVEYAARRARDWNAEIVTIGDHGHINEVSGWLEGQNLLTAFVAGLKGNRGKC